jgi:hypothetical protein
MLSLEKSICLKKPPKVQPPCAASPVVYSKLTLAKEPRASHCVEGFHNFIRALARELARADHAAQT